MKKIAFVGNMNNMLYPTAFYLSKDGYDCTLFFLKEYSNFKVDNLAKSITYKSILYEDPIELLDKSDDFKILFADFDYIIGTDWAPAICYLANKRLDCFYPAGSDFYDWPLHRWFGFNKLPNIFALKYLKLKYMQYLGINNALSVSIAQNVYMKEIFNKFYRIYEKLILPLPYLVDDISYKECLSSNDDLEFKKYSNQLSKYDHVIVHQTRHMWLSKNILNDGYKGNEILIYGFKDVLMRHTNCVLVLFAYGIDVEASKKLVNELSISNNVIWIPRVSQNVVRAIVESSSIGVGQLGSDWIFYCSSAEILHANIPFICSASLESFELNNVPLIPNYYSVANSEELTNAIIENIESNDNNVLNKSWLQNYNVDMPLKQLKKILSTKKNKSNSVKSLKEYLYLLKLEFGVLANYLRIFKNKYFA